MPVDLPTSPMIKTKSIATSVFQNALGATLLLVAVLASFSNWVSFTAFLFCALLVLPTARRQVAKHTGLELPGGVRTMLMVMLGVGGITALGRHEQAERADAQIQQAQKLSTQKTATFEGGKIETLAAIGQLIEQGKYDDARRLINTFKVVGDPELDALAQKLTALEVQQLRIARRTQLLGDVALEKDPGRIADIYVELQRVDPQHRKKYIELAVENRIVSERLKREASERQSRRDLGTEWRYQTSNDDMGGGVIRTASVRSENELHFEFPYQGKQRATFAIRHHPRWGLDVFIQIDRGQFLSCVSDCRATVRFDENRPQPIRLLTPSDMSNTTRFIDGADDLVGSLRRSRTVLIEVSFYNEGNRILRFRTDELDWQ